MSSRTVGICTSVVRRNEGKKAWLHLMYLGIPFPEKLDIPRQRKNIKEQLAKVVVGRLLPGTPSLGKHSVKMRPVCRLGESKGDRSA